MNRREAFLDAVSGGFESIRQYMEKNIVSVELREYESICHWGCFNSSGPCLFSIRRDEYDIIMATAYDRKEKKKRIYSWVVPE